ncbi:hypothetical protein Micbo1qcDRAFT_158932 [Microdochium bolleyi]|uniref:Uncharacterized protein n=1 Tax=Microdochium bolleyi TaxID=196109 RepID=A0A136J9Y1_9PEZI|nr:hypothetical protein Micbo1qcDRAFT_158932 [Microdochium bolleyi]
MELTPIRIPLKRSRNGGVSLDAGTSTPSTVEKRKIKRKKRTKQVSKTGREAIKASYFEKEVPLEVLERIFWLSENINLPFASLRFGRLLSGRPTLRETFISAFAPTWEVWHGCVNGSQRSAHRISSYAGWQEDVFRWGGNPNFQSALLSQPWADITMILESEQSWCNRFARGRFYEPAKLWGDAEIHPSVLSKVGHDLSALSVIHREFLLDYTALREVEKSDSPLPQAQSNTTETFIRVHKLTKIPDNLLTGPWNNDHDLQKLFWLVRAGARLSEDQTWEVTLEGFRNAVQGLETQWESSTPLAKELVPPAHSINLTVVRLLCMLDAFREWPRHLVQEQFDMVVRELDDARLDAAEAYYKYSYIASQLKPYLAST